MKSPLLLLALLALGCDAKEDTGAVDGLLRRDAGTVMLDSKGFSNELAFDVPPDAVSGVLACGAIGDDHQGFLTNLTEPNLGEAWNYKSPLSHPFRAGIFDDLIPVLIPVSPDLDISSGTWRASFYANEEEGTVLSCDSVWRVDRVGRGTLDLDIWLVGVRGIDSASAPENQQLQAMIAAFFDIWDDAFDAGDIVYHDIPNSDTWSVLDVNVDYDEPFAELNELLRKADPGRDRTLNVFLVKEIADAEGQVIVGLSGGPPGAATFDGTSKSGIVVATSDLDTDPAFVGRAMAHEAGHFLGLYHTTEKDASSFDPLADTPECGLEYDANANGTMNTDECEDIDGDNLMFWAGALPGTSDDQAWVVERNPAAR